MTDILGYEELYAVTKDGRVWSYRSNKFLKPLVNPDGYYTVVLCKNNLRKQISIHRLVAQTFIPNPNNLPEINHKDEVRTNNHIDNLEWCTHEYNNRYGTHGEKATEHFKKVVYCVELDKVFESARAAARELGLSHANISRCCRGIHKTSGGYHFEYKEV